MQLESPAEMCQKLIEMRMMQLGLRAARESLSQGETP